MTTITTTPVAKPVAVKIDADTRERVRRLAVARNRSPHWLMREAISQYVEREERREAFRQAGVEAWNAYRATGLHLTAKEADAWLAQLQTGKDAEPPECHG